MSDQKSNIDKAASIGNYLNLYFVQNQGVRLGESTVVSLKRHEKMTEKRIKGQIKILINQDAGKSYLDYVDNDQIVHIDVFHKKGEIEAEFVAKAIFFALDKYFLEKEPRLQYAEDERFKLVADFANRIFLATNQGKGILYELFQGKFLANSLDEEAKDHVHILARLRREEYYLVYIIVETVEEVILASDVQLAKVRNISHGNKKQQEQDLSGMIKLPWMKMKGKNAMALPDKENVNQLIMKLAEKFGGVEEIEEFMESYSTNIFKRKGIDQQKKKWGEVEHYVDQLQELGIMKDGIFGVVITKKGLEIKDYIMKHKLELETEIRRNMRKMPGGGSSRFKKFGQNENKSSQMEFTNRNKTQNDPEKNWSGDLAVPESVLQAKKNSFLRGDTRLNIKKGDLHYYKKKSYVPIDVCLLIDASGSMAGDKRQAACYLAEHLLLTGKEKVAVITFQENTSQVVVPFTRDQKILKRGLAQITPAGLTPLAHGIMAAVKHITTNKVRNPLLVLITDGIPNTPMWTTDAKADAIKASEYIPENKIRLICIGVECNSSYLKKLSDTADGALYMVDDLNKDNLINIVRYEKREMLKKGGNK